MSNQATRKLVLVFSLVVLLVASASLPSSMFSQTDVTEKSRTRRVTNSALPAPSPTPTPNPGSKQETPQDSDDVVRVETNLTSIFFTAADSSKRFIDNLTKEDIRILEDGQAQEIFTFQKNLELPLSIAILIDTSRSEERTLPDEKAAARAFVEAVMRPDRDEAAIVSFTGEVTLEQGFTGNLDRYQTPTRCSLGRLQSGMRCGRLPTIFCQFQLTTLAVLSSCSQTVRTPAVK